MRPLAIALVLMLASSCMSIGKRSLAADIPGNTEQAAQVTDDKQLSDQNDHHYIPRKYYGEPGSGQFDVTDDNDHHYIPRKDYGTHPGKE